MATGLVAAPVLALSSAVNTMGGAALAFPAPLDANMSVVIGAMMAATIVAAVAGVFLASIPGTVMEAQEAPAMVMGLMAASLYGTLSGDLAHDGRVVVVVAVFAVTTVVTGLFFLLLGSLRLGELIRYIPFPVIGGVLAGLGYLMFMGGLSVSTGQHVEIGHLSVLTAGDMPLRWGPAVAFCVVLFAATARIAHFSLVPSLLLTAMAIFYMAAFAAGSSSADLAAGHWLLGPFPEGALLAPVDFAALGRLDLATILGMVPSILSVILISTIGLLLHASGLELALRRDVNLDRELRACGVGTALGGLAGGVPAFHSMSGTMLARTMDAAHRLTPILMAAGLCLIVVYGGEALSLIPRPVLGGLLMFLGGALIWEWLIRGYRNLPRGDWVIVVMIVAIVAAVGYIEGLAFGVLAGVILFQLGYTKIDVVKHALSGAELRSNVDRGEAAKAALRDHGGATHVLELQGFVFFGTANNIVRRFRARLDDTTQPPVRYLILDFRFVEGLDWAAITSFRKMEQIGASAGVRVAVTGAAPAVKAMLHKGGMIGGDDAAFLEFDTLDFGLEHFETALLDELGVPSHDDAAPDRLPDWVAGQLDGGAMAARLTSYLTTETLSAGEVMLRQGETSDSLYFIQTGRASVYLEGDDGQQLRIKSYLSGSVLGEIGLYLDSPRTATVVADTDVRAFRLNRENFDHLREEDPALAARFHEIMVRLLGVRLADSNQLLTALSR